MELRNPQAKTVFMELVRCGTEADAFEDQFELKAWSATELNIEITAEEANDVLSALNDDQREFLRGYASIRNGSTSDEDKARIARALTTDELPSLGNLVATFLDRRNGMQP